MKVNIDEGVFNDAYLPYLGEMARTQVYFGGSSSGKSVFLAQRDVVDLMQGGRNFLVCRQVGRTLRGSVVQEIKKIISDWGLSDIMSVNKSDGTVTCSNGYQIVFAGLDDVEKLKSIVPAKGVFTDIRIEEATESDFRTVKQLMKRQRGGSDKTPKRLTLSFNPILKNHWIYKKYFAGLGWADEQTKYESDDLLILKTTYKDNKFLTAQDVADLESETDEYFYNVYTLGNWGVLGNVIFTNWKVEDLSGMQDQFTNHRHGLDFGYSADPAAGVFTHYDNKRKTIYIYDELYEKGLTNDVLAVHVIEKAGDSYVVCDSAEPKSIAELQRDGVSALSAEKGKDSVNFGIQWLQRQSIVIDKGCVNTINEFSQYKWKEDKSGEALRKPIDKFNHAIDGLRYAYERDMKAARTVAWEW